MLCSVSRATKLFTCCVAAFTWLYGANADDDGSRPPLRTVSDVRRLSSVELASRPPVSLTGVVTYCEPAWFLTFVEDETGGIYLGTTPATRLRAGDRVRVNGVASTGLISAIISGKAQTEPAVTVLGRSELPAAREADPEHLFDNTYDASWVAVRGVVRSVSRVNDRARILMETNGWHSFTALVHGPFEDRNLPRYLVGCTVVVHGVIGGADERSGVDTNSVLYVPTLNECTLEPHFLAKQFSVPLDGYPDLFRKSGKVRVEGVVTHVRAGFGFFMRVLDRGYPSAAIWVQTSQPIDIACGSRVDVVAALQYSNLKPWLQDAIVRLSNGNRVPVEPQHWSVNQITASDSHGMLVSIEGTVIEQRHGLHEDSLILLCSNVAGCVRLESPGTESSLPIYQKGSRLRVVGTTLVRALPGMEVEPHPFRFQIAARDARDITLLSLPPWWTMEKLLILLGGMLGIAATGFIWAGALRRRVTAQTAAIRRHVERETLQEERMRMAREFHDTFEQHLVGLGLTLQTAQADASLSPRIRDLLKEAVEMARHTRTEARHAIWEMRTGNLVASDLPSLLRTELIGIAEAAHVELHVNVLGIPQSLPAVVQNHLLRIAQESVTNAIKHAVARQIKITLEFREKELALTIADNGTGFDANVVGRAITESFGLKGMRERAIRMRGKLQILSAPGNGTEINVTIPLETK